MSYEQQADIYAAADFLGITVPTVKRRITAGTFPAPDSTDYDAVEWWSIETLVKHQATLKRKKTMQQKASTRKRRV